MIANKITLGILGSGEELLQGRLVDTNSAWVANHLKVYGFENRLISIAGDNLNEIKKMIHLSFHEYGNKLTVITGGLGPTKDDLARDAIAGYFNTSLQHNFSASQSMTTFFKKINRNMNDVPQSNWVQCMFPQNSVCIKNEFGTAPGIWLEQDGKAIVSLPGVPHEMKPMLASLPLLFPDFFAGFAPYETELITVASISESKLGELLAGYMNPHQAYDVGITAKKGYILISISGYQKDLNLTIKKEILELVSEWLVSENGLLPNQELIKILKEKKWKIGTVESCTGGLLADAFVSESGASEVFKHGAVTYSNESKVSIAGVLSKTIDDFGAVSEETAKEMAKEFAQKTKLDVCLSTSGIAGPDGGTPEKPIGYVCMGVYIKGETLAFTKIFPGDRTSVRERTVNSLLAETIILIRRSHCD